MKWYSFCSFLHYFVVVYSMCYMRKLSCLWKWRCYGLAKLKIWEISKMTLHLFLFLLTLLSWVRMRRWHKPELQVLGWTALLSSYSCTCCSRQNVRDLRFSNLLLDGAVREHNTQKAFLLHKLVSLLLFHSSVPFYCSFLTALRKEYPSLILSLWRKSPVYFAYLI